MGKTRICLPVYNWPIHWNIFQRNQCTSYLWYSPLVTSKPSTTIIAINFLESRCTGLPFYWTWPWSIESFQFVPSLCPSHYFSGQLDWSLVLATLSIASLSGANFVRCWGTRWADQSASNTTNVLDIDIAMTWTSKSNNGTNNNSWNKLKAHRSKQIFRTDLNVIIVSLLPAWLTDRCKWDPMHQIASSKTRSKDLFEA